VSRTYDLSGTFVWRPTIETIQRAHLTHFMHQHSLPSFSELMQRSTEDISWFTEAVLRYLQIEFYHPYTQVVDLSDGVAWARWATDGKLNIVHKCLDKYMSNEM